MAYRVSFERNFESRWKLPDAAKDRIAVTLDSPMEVIRSTARSVCSADGVSFVLRDGDRCRYADEDAIGPLRKSQRFPMTSCISGWCMLNDTAIGDVFADPRIPRDAYRKTFVKSLIMVPVRTAAPVAAYWREQRSFAADDIAAIEAPADAVGLALGTARAA